MEIRKYLDVHAHFQSQRLNGDSIISLSAFNDRELIKVIKEKHPNLPVSVGLHPWHLTEDWKTDLENFFFPAVKELNAIAIGETGLDSYCYLPIEKQLEAFKAQAEFANKEGLPLIIHCVKAFDLLIACHRDIKPHEPWIIHGFRGKATQAKQLLSLGFSLSFGVHFNPEALRICPVERLFIESDESHLTIEEIYAQIAKIRDKSTASLQKEILNLY